MKSSQVLYEVFSSIEHYKRLNWLMFLELLDAACCINSLNSWHGISATLLMHEDERAWKVLIFYILFIAFKAISIWLHSFWKFIIIILNEYFICSIEFLQSLKTLQFFGRAVKFVVILMFLNQTNTNLFGSLWTKLI